MAIDILNLKPTTVSRDLRGKYVMVYGNPKVGKTSFAAKFKKNLLLAFEIGYNALDNVYAQPVQKWAELKTIIRQLEDPRAREMYDTITIDTVGIMYDACEKFICQQNGVQKISEIPWGAGYTATKNEFENTLRHITMLGYGLILLAHADTRKETVDNSEIEFYSPALNKRCYEICNRIVDVIGYIGIEWDENGESHRYLYTRQTPRVVAGSRFKYLAPKIEFGYEQLVNAVADAIEKQAKLDGATIVDKAEKQTEEKLDFNQVRAEAQELWTKLIAQDQNNASIILKKIEMTMGHKMKLSEFTEDQCDLLALVVDEMKTMQQIRGEKSPLICFFIKFMI